MTSGKRAARYFASRRNDGVDAITAGADFLERSTSLLEPVRNDVFLEALFYGVVPS
jgi:hypothetical protein